VSERIAFIGLGNMGLPMAQRLVAAGHTVTGADLAAGAREALVTAGGAAVDDVVDAVRDASFVILMLPDSGVVEAVLRTDGLVTALRPDAVVVDMSSSEPERTRAIARELPVAVVDAPVSGGVARAKAGTLTIMAGGTPDVVASVAQVLAPLGTLTRAGDVGAGHATKAINNLMSATHLLATAEAVAAGQRFGLDPEVLLSIVNTSSGRSGSTENKWPNFVLPGTFDSGFGLRLMLKDMRIALGLSEGGGTPAELSRRAVELWAEAADALPAGADHTEVARWVADRTDAG
jgi:3-hydroxyisobutyrate dehydrogenase